MTDIVEALRALRRDIELRFSGQFVENMVCTLDAALAEIERLRALSAPMEEEVDSVTPSAASPSESPVVESQASEAPSVDRGEVERLRGALLRFGNHGKSCASRGDYIYSDARTRTHQPCDCGYVAALARPPQHGESK